MTIVQQEITWFVTIRDASDYVVANICEVNKQLIDKGKEHAPAYELHPPESGSRRLGMAALWGWSYGPLLYHTGLELRINISTCRREPDKRAGKAGLPLLASINRPAPDPIRTRWPGRRHLKDNMLNNAAPQDARPRNIFS